MKEESKFEIIDDVITRIKEELTKLSNIEDISSIILAYSTKSSKEVIGIWALDGISPRTFKNYISKFTDLILRKLKKENKKKEEALLN